MKNLLIAGVLLLAGCAQSRITAPEGQSLDLDAASRTNASMNALVSAPGMTGIAALGGRMPAELGAPTVAPAFSAAGMSGIPALALRLLRSLPTAAAPEAVQVIRPSVLGHTYTYNTTTHRYEPNASRSGAPSNGVRFILYAVGPDSHEPIVSQEIGYADLTDQMVAGFAVSLRLRAVASGSTFLDYAFTLTPSLGGGSLEVTGFLADDHNRLDFTLGATGAGVGSTQAAHVTFDLAVASQHFHATGAIDATSGEGGGTAHVDVSITIGADGLRLLGQSNAAEVNASLSVNGRLFANITGDPHHPTVRGEGGRELTPAEIVALGGLVGMVYGVIETFQHLLEPVAALLGISILL